MRSFAHKPSLHLPTQATDAQVEVALQHLATWIDGSAVTSAPTPTRFVFECMPELTLEQAREIVRYWREIEDSKPVARRD